MFFTCDFAECDQRFKSKKALKEHKRTHDKGRPFKCDLCDQTFTQYSSLQKHGRVHDGEKPYTCEHEGCHQSFSQVSNLIRHQRIHSGDKPYVCDKCNKQFASGSNLKQHSQIHGDSEERSQYPCMFPPCDKRYLYPSSLKKHYNMSHEAEFNLYCEQNNIRKVGFDLKEMSSTISINDKNKGPNHQNLNNDLGLLNSNPEETLQINNEIQPQTSSQLTNKPLVSKKRVARIENDNLLNELDVSQRKRLKVSQQQPIYQQQEQENLLRGQGEISFQFQREHQDYIGNPQQIRVQKPQHEKSQFSRKHNQKTLQKQEHYKERIFPNQNIMGYHSAQKQFHTGNMQNMLGNLLNVKTQRDIDEYSLPSATSRVSQYLIGPKQNQQNNEAPNMNNFVPEFSNPLEHFANFIQSQHNPSCACQSHQQHNINSQINIYQSCPSQQCMQMQSQQTRASDILSKDLEDLNNVRLCDSVNETKVFKPTPIGGRMRPSNINIPRQQSFQPAMFSEVMSAGIVHQSPSRFLPHQLGTTSFNSAISPFPFLEPMQKRINGLLNTPATTASNSQNSGSQDQRLMQQYQQGSPQVQNPFSLNMIGQIQENQQQNKQTISKQEPPHQYN